MLSIGQPPQKKHVTISYHKTREAAAAGIAPIKTGGVDNFADVLLSLKH
jgi:hypothetical protein